MLRFIAIRILSTLPVLAILSVIAFTIIQIPPGDYGDVIMSNAMGRGGASHSEALAQAEAYREANGLNRPVVVQYFSWIWGIVSSGDFGQSFFHNKPVADIVSERLPATFDARTGVPCAGDRFRPDYGHYRSILPKPRGGHRLVGRRLHGHDHSAIPVGLDCAVSSCISI